MISIPLWFDYKRFRKRIAERFEKLFQFHYGSIISRYENIKKIRFYWGFEDKFFTFPAFRLVDMQ